MILIPTKEGYKGKYFFLVSNDNDDRYTRKPLHEGVAIIPESIFIKSLLTNEIFFERKVSTRVSVIGNWMNWIKIGCTSRLASSLLLQ